MKNTKKLLIVLLGILLLTGCTTQLKSKETKKAITIKETGQVLTKNILCKPSDELKSHYTENLEGNELETFNKLPKCENFKVTSGGYEGIWTSIIVKPLAWLIIQIGKIVKNYGFGLILASLAIRLALFPITKSTAMQSELLKKAKPELDKLEKKYAGKNDQASMMAKSREMAMVYKKYNIKPVAGCLFALLQIPLFIGFYEAINRVPAIFEGTLLGFQLGTTPLTGLSNGNMLYIILPVIVGVTTYFSLTLNSASNPDNKQMASMSKIMFIMITIMSFFVTSALAFYWITTSLFTIGQNLLVKRNREME